MSRPEGPADAGGDTDAGGAPGRKSPQEAPDQDQELTLLQMISSVLAAAFGVQSSRNRERDFSRGKPLHFIVLGILFTALFVLAVVSVVNLVLGSV